MAAPEALLAADKVPHVAPLQPVPVSVHVTPLFCVSFVTVAVKFWVLLTLTVAAVGARATATAAVTVMDAFDVFVVSPTDVAFRVTAAGLGTLAGALYVTEVVVTFVSVPHAAPLPGDGCVRRTRNRRGELLRLVRPDVGSGRSNLHGNHRGNGTRWARARGEGNRDSAQQKLQNQTRTGHSWLVRFHEAMLHT